MLAATGVKHGPSKTCSGDVTLQLGLNMKILSVGKVYKYHIHKYVELSQTM